MKKKTDQEIKKLIFETYHRDWYTEDQDMIVDKLILKYGKGKSVLSQSKK